MSNENKDKNTNEEKKSPLGPDPETLHTTDPQEHMKGPVSSTMKGIEKEAEKGNQESKEEATQRKDANT
jgi:hypothetical protein